jgi:thioester reductase-like protein
MTSCMACADGACACAGDLAQPQLGLSQAVYDSLCAELDTIVHNGALVNHAYSYEQLFEPNVLGSVEVRPSSCCAPQAFQVPQPR